MDEFRPEKLELRSKNVVSEQIKSLLNLFPEVGTEGGKIDFDRLRLTLGAVVDAGKERYEIRWPGKSDCFHTIQTPSRGTLLPNREQSVNFDSTENVIIEGDNLEVLKLLQKSYLGKIKMIFIDPPYNTGNDFIYPDNYSESLQTYLEYTGQVDANGRKFGTNTDTDGRFHSKWLNMIYPRLFLARNLLRNDGAIFITIDDCEFANLRRVCDEIFGEENFVAAISWQKKYAVSNNHKGVASVRDFVLVYSKSVEFQNGLLPRTEESTSRYQNPDNDPRGPWKPVDYWNVASPEDRPNLVYPIKNPKTGKTINPEKKAWKYSKETHEQHVLENRIWWGVDGINSVPALKLFLSEVRDGLIPHNWWSHEDAGHTDEAKKELDRLFGGNAPFDTPKPVRLIERACQVGNVGKEDIVLDFFAGSGSTAHAVLNLNRKDGGNRKFILVQLPEAIHKEGYSTIASITSERVRRAIDSIASEDGVQAQSAKAGFRYFSLAESNFVAWDGQIERTSTNMQKQLELYIEHIREGRRTEDILFEILLKSGFSLSTEIASESIREKTVYSVAGGALQICLEDELNIELIKEVAQRKPDRVVCLDRGFARNDQLKANAMQIFKTNGVESFKTF